MTLETRNPFIRIKDTVMSLKEKRTPKTPEQILSSHGIIDVTEWLRATAANSPVEAAYLKFNTSEGEIDVFGDFGKNQPYPNLRLARLNRRPNPIYGTISGDHTLKLVVTEAHTPDNQVARTAYLAQLSNELITSGHNFRLPNRRRMLRVPGVAKLVEDLAKTKNAKKQKKLSEKLDILFKTKGLNPHNVDEPTEAPRDIVFQHTKRMGREDFVFVSSKRFSRILNPQDTNNVSVSPIEN